MFFESLAYAQGSQAPAAPAWLAGVMNLVPFVAIFAIFYFLLIKPQQKKQKEQEELIKNLKKNDKVLTQGGIYGSVSELAEDWIMLRVNDKVEIKFSRNAISGKVD